MSDGPDAVDYEYEFNCDPDSDSEADALFKKFDSIYGGNYWYRKEVTKEGQSTDWTPEEEGKINPPNVNTRKVYRHDESSSTAIQADSSTAQAEEDLDSDPKCQIKRSKTADYGERWKKWALESMKICREIIEDYNEAKAFFYISVAGYFGENEESGIGVLIRNRRGGPVAAFSGYSREDKMRVSPFYQEMRAVCKGIDMAMELKIKYIHMICTSGEASIAITNCDRGGPCSEDDMVYNLSFEIMDKLQERRVAYEGSESPRVYFTNFPGGKMYNTAARYLARLEFEGEMGAEQLGSYPGLMDVIMKDATGLSDVRLFHKGYDSESD